MPGGYPPCFDEGGITMHLEPTLLPVPDQALSLEPLPDRRQGHVEPMALLQRLLQSSAGLGARQGDHRSANGFIMLARTA
jgi:hypothetical protein